MKDIKKLSEISRDKKCIFIEFELKECNQGT